MDFEEEGELSQSLGGQGGGGKGNRGEGVKAEEEGGLHGNKSGLREIRLPESEFVCNNNTNYSLSLRSLTGACRREKLGVGKGKIGGLGEGGINLLNRKSRMGVWGGG